MDRIEKVREKIDSILLRSLGEGGCKDAYVHLYGVAQACALIALRRGENVELAVIAGMLHDIYSYAALDTQEHAHKGAEMAREILDAIGGFTEAETQLICTAIYHHSDKANVHAALDEVLKDADVMQHVLYDPLAAIKPHEQKRFHSLQKELGVATERGDARV